MHLQFLSLMFFYSLSVTIAAVKSAPTTDLLPQPVAYAPIGEAIATVTEQFQFVDVSEVHSDVVTAALSRYRRLIFGTTSRTLFEEKVGTLERLHISVTAPEAHPSPFLGIDESYELVVRAPIATLVAASAFGALHGLETFSQLFRSASPPLRQIPCVNVSDAPRFPYRGLMVDPARRFLPLQLLHAVIDSLAYAKLNVLHLHMTDDQSWPLQIAAFPELSRLGAFSPDHTYSALEMKKLVEYARLRGVRILVEIDMPGHSAILALSRPELLTSCPGIAPYGLTRNNLDPTRNSTFSFINTLMEELFETFSDKYVFLGGDEVDTRCWAANANVTSWLRRHNMSVSQIQAYFERKLVELVRSNFSKDVIVWQEVFQSSGAKPVDVLGSSAVIDVWKGGQGKATFDVKVMEVVTASGLRGIVSSCWYLDIFSPGKTDWGREWVDYYTCDPHAFNGTAEMKARVIGGHGAIWGEATDATNLLPRVWPRLAAAAERLWSPRAVAMDFEDFARRLHLHRCRLLARGIAASPVGTLGDPYVPDNVTIGPGSRTFCPGDVKFKYDDPSLSSTSQPHIGIVDIIV